MLSQQSRDIIDEFGRHPEVTPDQVATLHKVLRDSPALTEQFNGAVAQRQLSKLVPLTNPNAAGEYHPADRSIHISLTKLTPLPANAYPAKIDAFHGEITFILGHELEHGLNHAEHAESLERFGAQVREVARSKSPVHDYTDAVGDRLGADRRNEAEAEIAGWNSIVSAVRSRQNSPTLKEIYEYAPTRMADFIDKAGGYANPSYALKPNLTLNPDHSLSPSPENVEAMGQNYFDKAGDKSHLGPYGRSDYANHYGASAIADVVRIERENNRPQLDGESPRIAINMAALRLDEKLLEENGINLGKNTQRMPYQDISTTPASLHHFDHTAVTRAHVPITAGRTTPDDASHPDHAMLLQIREGVGKIDVGIGKPYDEMSERISRSLLVACKDNRDAYPEARDYSLSGNALNRVDHVVLGTNGVNVFAVEGRLDDPAHKRCHVSTQEALQTPVEQSDQKLLVANQAIAQEQQLAQQQALSQQVDAPSHGGFGR